jgi:prophage regulatory protein
MTKLVPEHSATTPPRRILRRHEVLNLTGLSDPNQWRLEKAGLFPARVKITPMMVGWYSDEVAEWINTRERGGGRVLSAGYRHPPKTPGVAAEAV